MVLLSAGGCAHTEKSAESSEEERDFDDPAWARDAESTSVSSVWSDEIDRRNIERVEELLRDAAGIGVHRTRAGGFSVRIRRSRSISGDNEPLYVIDGVPTSPLPGPGIVGINPYDIESIDVLKGSAASVYGDRGANGVVVSKTKHGR